MHPKQGYLKNVIIDHIFCEFFLHGKFTFFRISILINTKSLETHHDLFLSGQTKV